MNIYLFLLALIILLFFSAFFSASETALMSINQLRLFHLSQKGDKRAKKVRRLLKQRHTILGTILVGNNFVNVAASVLATALGIYLVGERGLVYVTIFMTFIIIVFCEITPKLYASSHAEDIARRIAAPIQLSLYILKPIVLFITKCSNLILEIFGQTMSDVKNNVLTTDEIRSVIILGEKEGAIAPSEKKMLQSILELTKTTVKEVMVPRTELVGLNIESSKEVITELVVKTGFSRFPVYKESIDNIIGVVHSKDLITQDAENFSLSRIIKRPFFVPESMKIHHLLSEFKKGEVHLAIVVDEYGGIEGMVTLEDVLEEIVGEIKDEFDIPSSSLSFLHSDDGSILVKGNITLKDLKRYLNLDFGYEENNTLSGLILEKLGHLPKQGEVLEFKGYKLTVMAMRRQKIVQVKLEMV